MRCFRIARGFFLRFDRGEDLPGGLLDFFRTEQLGSAVISGLGAVEHTTLGYYDLERRDYSRREYPGSMELLSLTGNLCWAEEQPVVHAHAVIAGADGVAYGGHLFEARISVTGEIMVWAFDERRHRALDATTGLKLISDR